MPFVPFFVLAALGGTLVGMFAFILGRRAWRARDFRRRDRYRDYWFRRLPSLLAGDTPGSQEMRVPEARETLESILVNRLETAEGAEQKQLSELIERAGLLDQRIRLLQKGPRWERLYSATLLGQMRSPGAIPALVEALEEDWPPLCSAALRSLGRIGSAAAGPAILGYLQRGRPVEPNLWLEAAVACVPDLEDFASLLQDEREEVRVLAARSIAESPHPARFDSLNRFVFHPDPEVRAQVLRTLGRSRDGRAVSLLIAATHDSIWFVRLRALGALAELGDPSTLDAVLHAVKDSNFQVRQRAAATLASLVSCPGEALEKLLSSNDEYAVEALLSQLARSGLLWRSLPLLRSPQEQVRRDAEKLWSGAIAAGYHAILLNALETHPEWRVRVAIARLLARMDHPALVTELEQRLAAAPTTRLRRLLRAVLRSQTSCSGEKTRAPLARPA